MLVVASVATVAGQTIDFVSLQARLEGASYGLNAAALQDPTTYQSHALQRTSQQGGVDSFSDYKLVQYYTLYCIYYATYAIPNTITEVDPQFQGVAIPSWLTSTNWDQISVDPCNGWYGIECDSNGRVMNINLSENFLTGIWPAEVKLLAVDGPFSTGAGNLSQIDLFRNMYLSNGGDSSWISDLGSSISQYKKQEEIFVFVLVRVLRFRICSNFLVVCPRPIVGSAGTIMLEETGFSGDLPSMPASIVNFNAAGTLYTGGFIDANFVSCVNLNYLDLELTQFSTSIPSVLSTLPKLEYLYLSDTLITGTLASLQGMPAIRELWMDGNPGLLGPLETSFGNFMTLESLSLAYNNLSGELPSELGLLTNLKQIWFYGNNFTGAIPSEIGALPQLSVLQLEGNSFQGWVPPTICVKTEFPTVSLKSFGADCHDDEFWCPCCSCCDLTECMSVSTSTRKERRYLRRNSMNPYTTTKQETEDGST
jgi:hypothetical protein